jgi:hypothetical protein
MDKFERLAKLADRVADLRGTESLVTEAAISARLGGATWDEVGFCLGITKQAAFKRYSGMLGYEFPAPE